jgi:peptidyl-dipeptidase A
MAMKNSELDPEEIGKLFDDLDNATRDTYKEVKGKMDEALATSYGIGLEELRPWHYRDRFFQDVPDIFGMDLDKYYSDKDVLVITSDYYSRIGMDMSDIVRRSDLYEREGKYQHAMATFIDRKDDVRIVTNIKNDSKWTGTLLHEFGHAAYFKEIDKDLPWELRESGHILTTEAIAIMFQDMIYSPDWMIRVAGLSENEVKEVGDRCKEYSRLDKLIFSRWDQVMYRFEKSMYENPDQDLNALWWELVEKYQMIRKPEGRNAPDWASKIHIASSPVYYHNYLLGHLYGAQIRRYIADNILRSSEDMPSYIDNEEVGKYLIREIFRLGNLYSWNELIRRSTGKFLGIEDFVKEVE